jgi:hypothetical protein
VLVVELNHNNSDQDVIASFGMEEKNAENDKEETLIPDTRPQEEEESVNETADQVAMQLIEILIMKFKEKVLL